MTGSSHWGRRRCRVLLALLLGLAGGFPVSCLDGILTQCEGAGELRVCVCVCVWKD